MAKELTARNLLKVAAGGYVGEVMKLLDMSSTGQSEIKANGDNAKLNVRDEYGKTALHLAVDDNNIVAIQTLVDAGVNINLQDGSKQTPLQLAVQYDSPSCIEELVKLGADLHCVDSEGRNAFIRAVEYERENCLQLMIKMGADVNCVDSKGRTPLMLAAKSGREKILLHLINARADLNLQVKHGCGDFFGPTALMFAAENVYLECLNFLLGAGADANVKTSDGETALHFACKSPFWLMNSVIAECIKSLLAYGADVSINSTMGQTVLMYAARKDWLVSLLPILEEAGAIVDQQDSRGMTALTHAVSTGSQKCLRWLIDHGASVNIRDLYGKTPLHHVMSESKNDDSATHCLEILFTKQPDVNATDKDGITPLMYMARKSGYRIAMMAMLLEHGADVNLVDNQGQTALIHSLKLELRQSYDIKDTSCISFLINNGASRSVGRIASGQLSRLAFLYRDINLVNLQVGSTVDLNASWKHFVSIFNSKKRKILQFLIINGVMPSQPRSLHAFEDCSMLTNTSLLESAAVRGNAGMVKYFISTCYIRAEDLKFVCSKHVEDNCVLNVMKNLGSQPWPLVKLCFVAVSTAFGASPGRQERVKNSQLPRKLQNMLLFQEPWSRLCVRQWDKIPLTFSHEKYEKLTRPRPLFYHWPVGRPLVPCYCGKCNGTMFKYEGSDEDV